MFIAGVLSCPLHKSRVKVLYYSFMDIYRWQKRTIIGTIVPIYAIYCYLGEKTTHIGSIVPIR